MRELRPIPIELMREYLSYDPITGRVTNIKSRQGCTVGAEAGRDTGHGYRKIFFFGVYYYTHRVAWALRYNEQPPPKIDHRFGNGLNNSERNMRPASHRENMRNTKRRVDNSSGYKGVTWHAGTRKWRASIKAPSGQVHLGLFEDVKLAANAYAVAADKLFGEFARAA